MSIQARIMVKSRCVFVSLLFRIVSRLNHFQLHLFMFSKVNVTLLRQFLGFYCPSKLGLWLNHDAFLYHYYLGLYQALNHFQLHLFMFSKVNVTLLRQFLGFYCPSKLGLWLNHDAFLYHYYLGSFLD